MKRAAVCMAWLLAWLALAGGARAEVNASVDRATLTEGETLVLTVTVSGDNEAEPDFSALRGSGFDLLSTSQSSSFRYINGRMEGRRSWYLTLAPTRSGRLMIPAIPIGSEMTHALHVEVKPASEAAAEGRPPDLFIEVTTDPAGRAYVQSQVALAVKIFYATELQGGRLSDLEVEGAVVQRLGNDRVYWAERHGRRYQVIERRFALFPQSSGELTIPPLTFQGSVRIAGAPPRPAFGGLLDPLGRIGSGSRQVRARSEALTLSIEPRPAGARGRWWLPAREVVLEQRWVPDPPRFRVGEPVTRTVVVRARGLGAAQLPEIELPGDGALKFYADPPRQRDREEQGWIVGERSWSVALVPTEPGRFTLPAIEIEWWDTATDQPRVARLPEQVVEVAPAPSQEAAAPPVAPVPAEEESAATEEMEALPAAHAAPFWPWLSAVLALGWLVTALLWWRGRRGGDEGGGPVPAPRESEARKRLARACRAGDARAARQALLQWSAARWPGRAPTLERLGRWLGPEVAEELERLDRVLYGGGEGPWRGDGLWRRVRAALAQREREEKREGAAPLPPLYPTGEER